MILGIGVLSFSHVLLFLWRYELLPFALIWCIPLICIAAIGLMISEIKWNGITKFVEYMTTSHNFALGFVVLIAALANLTLIGPGYIHADGIFHAFKVWYLRKAWLNGSFYPLWCPYWYSGYPFLEFYGPLFYVFAAFLSLGSDWMFGSKLALYLASIMAPMAMYGLIYVITEDRLGGIVGGIAYTLTYYKFPLLTKFGHLSSSLVLVFLPLLFLFFELTIKKKKQIFAVYAGFCWAGVFLSHQGDGYIITLLVIFYLMFSCAINFNLKNIYFIGRMSLISAGVALGLSSFFIIPFLIDGINANISMYVYPGKLGNPISLSLILTRDFINIYQPFPVYIGNSILALAFMAIFLRRTRATIVYTAVLLCSFFFVLSSGLPFYSEIPFITSLDYFPYRFLLLISFVASVLSGITIASIKTMQKPLSGYFKKLVSTPMLQKRIIVILMVIIIIDLWPGTLVSKNRPVNWILDDNWINTYNWLNEHPGYYKTLRLGSSGPGYHAYHAVIGNTFDTSGAFPQSENQDYSKFNTMVGKKIKSLTNAPEKGFLNPLKILGVKYVLLDSSMNYAKHLIASNELEVVQTYGDVVILEYSGYSSSVIVSQAAAFLEEEEEEKEIETFYAYVTEPDYDPSKMIFLKEQQYYSNLEIPLSSPEEALDHTGSFTSTIHNLRVEENTIHTKIEVSAPSFVFFSFNFFPGWKALIDGHESQILIAEPFFMCLYINTNGTHEITLEYHLNMPKTIGLFITVFTLLISLFVILWPSRKTIKEKVKQYALRKYKR